jgi:hypothetical protein
MSARKGAVGVFIGHRHTGGSMAPFVYFYGMAYDSKRKARKTKWPLLRLE